MAKTKFTKKQPRDKILWARISARTEKRIFAAMKRYGYKSKAEYVEQLVENYG